MFQQKLPGIGTAPRLKEKEWTGGREGKSTRRGGIENERWNREALSWFPGLRFSTSRSANTYAIYMREYIYEFYVMHRVIHRTSYRRARSPDGFMREVIRIKLTSARPGNATLRKTPIPA